MGGRYFGSNYSCGTSLMSEGLKIAAGSAPEWRFESAENPFVAKVSPMSPE
jgi:hypothetical protein